MKTIIIVLMGLTSIFSIGAIACPDLSGEYAACSFSSSRALSKMSNVSIAQITKNGIATFLIGADIEGQKYRQAQILTANGVRESKTVHNDDLGDITAWTSASCTNNTLAVDTSDSFLGDVKGVVTYSINGNKDLVIQWVLEGEGFVTFTCK